MTSPYRPPSVDLPPEFYKLKLKPCPVCGAVAAVSTSNTTVMRCSDLDCLCYGPWRDPHGTKWNSIPRRSEVLELLRLVSIVHKAPPGQPRDWEDGRKKLIEYADKLREEIEE